MTIQRITISVPGALAKQIKRAAGERPVSAWVTSLIEERLHEAELEQLWAEFVRDNPPTPAETREADAIYRRLTRKRRAT